jgi:hypothetical protein
MEWAWGGFERPTPRISGLLRCSGWRFLTLGLGFRASTTPFPILNTSQQRRFAGLLGAYAIMPALPREPPIGQNWASRTLLFAKEEWNGGSVPGSDHSIDPTGGYSLSFIDDPCAVASAAQVYRVAVHSSRHRDVRADWRRRSPGRRVKVVARLGDGKLEFLTRGAASPGSLKRPACRRERILAARRRQQQGCH